MSNRSRHTLPVVTIGALSRLSSLQIMTAGFPVHVNGNCRAGT
jgi:hypothetical protein